MEGRAAAAAARQEAGLAGSSKAAKSIVEWSPSRNPTDPSFGRVAPPSLHKMCLEILCANIEHVESLEGVPDATKRLISAGTFVSVKHKEFALVRLSPN